MIFSYYLSILAHRNDRQKLLSLLGTQSLFTDEEGCIFEEGGGAITKLPEHVSDDWRFGKFSVAEIRGDDYQIDMSGSETTNQSNQEEKVTITGTSRNTSTTSTIKRRNKPSCIKSRDKEEEVSTALEISRKVALGTVFPFKKRISEFERGIIRLYRHRELESRIGSESDGLSIPLDVHLGARCSLLLCILHVPSYISHQDFLTFLGPSQHSISRIYIIKDAILERYLSLVCFRIKEDALEFYKKYDGKSFVSFYPDKCRIMYIKCVKFTTYSDSKPLETEFRIKKTPLYARNSIITELPTCPVCLDRLDSSATGLITLVCYHTFHINCMIRWDNSSCPVCRYSPKTPNPIALTETTSECYKCGIRDNLWICLICGQVGCGRYDGGHAVEHYSETYHIYSMDLKTKSVWDYVGDTYVHRLVQNNSDGKLVELGPPSFKGTDQHKGSEASNCPTDTVSNLYSEEIRTLSCLYGFECSSEPLSVELMRILVLAQLESQKDWYESYISKTRMEYNSKIDVLESKIDELNDMNRALAEKNELLESEISFQAKRISKLNLVSEASEKESNANAVMYKFNKELEAFKLDSEKKDKEIAELRDQIRDMMFHMDVFSKLKEGADIGYREIEGGYVQIPSVPPTDGSTSKKRLVRRKKTN